MKNTISIFCLLLFMGFVNAQDSDFVRAKKTLSQIDNGLTYLKKGDVNAYNNLTSKLTAARTLLESTNSKSDKEYGALVKRWNADRDKLTKIAETWSKPIKKSRTKEPRVSSSQIYNNIIQKYQARNRPQIASSPSAQEVVEWATKMSTLINITMKTDTQKMEKNFANGKVNKQDKNRFDRWVNGTWRNQIIEQINTVKQSFEGKVMMALDKANFINRANKNDDNKILNIGGVSQYTENSKLFITGLTNIAYASALDSILNTPQEQEREKQRQIIESAQQNLEIFKSKNKGVSKKIAAMPQKAKKQSTSQKLWLDGRVICEITRKGEVWINSEYVGTISPEYKIWVSKNDNYGSIEKNGEVWHNGNFIGVISENGDVRSKVKNSGSIGKDGKVWFGTQAASIEGPGDWKRAAIVYFFDFF